MSVTVHTKPNCVQCKATFRKLDKEGIPYIIVQLTDESVVAFKDAGHMQAPIVVTSAGTFSGYRPDLIMKMKEEQP